jgi:beta-glucosidase
VYGGALADAVRRGAVPEAVVEERLDHLARLSRRIATARAAQPDPAVCDPPSTHGRLDPPEPLTRAAAAGFVLLKNDAGLLPLTGRPRVLAVLGPNAVEPCYQGYGSSMVSMGPTVDPLAAIAGRFPGTRVIAEPGCSLDYPLRGLDRLPVMTPGARSVPGFLVEYFQGPDAAGPPSAREVRRTSWLIWGQRLLAVPADEPAFVRLTTVLTPDRSGRHTFSVRGSGPTRILVDGAEVAALAAQSGPHDIIAAWFSDELGEGHVDLQAGRPVRVEIEMRCEPGMYHLLLFGCRPPAAPDLLKRAVDAAGAADAVVVVVGTDQDIETESRDRATTALAGGQDELVERVLAVNPASTIVVNAGRAVALPWAEKASTILYSWLGGHAFGPALARVLAGDVEPGGRLPISIAAHADDYPGYNTTPDAGGRLHYRDSHFVGYRGFDAAGATPAFCFGHGIGYTDFAYERLTLPTSHSTAEPSVTAAVAVRNTGPRTGKEVVQVYVSGPAVDTRRPPLQLTAFSAVTVAPGESVVVYLDADPRSFAYWDTDRADWTVEPGEYGIHVGRSSRDIRLTTNVTLVGSPLS